MPVPIGFMIGSTAWLTTTQMVLHSPLHVVLNRSIKGIFLFIHHVQLIRYELFCTFDSYKVSYLLPGWALCLPRRYGKLVLLLKATMPLVRGNVLTPSENSKGMIIADGNRSYRRTLRLIAIGDVVSGWKCWLVEFWSKMRLIMARGSVLWDYHGGSRHKVC